MSHIEAMNAPICCNGSCNQGRTCPQRNAPLHSKNGGNVIDHGEALAQIESDARHTEVAWVIALGALWLAVLVVLIKRIV